MVSSAAFAFPSPISLSAPQSSTNTKIMASLLGKLSPPPMFVTGRHTLLATLQKVNIVTSAARQGIITKATSDTSETSSSLSVIKSVQNAWDNSEDRLALFGLGFAAVVALWASTNLVAAIDKLPVIPSALELVGILFSSWFIYRYLLFKPDREELSRGITKWIAEILGR